MRLACTELFAQYLMDEGHGNRSFSNRGGHALDAAATDVAHGKYARQTGFEQKRRAGERPAGGVQIFARQSRSGLDEAFVIKRHAAIEPTRVGDGAGHDEDMAYVARLNLPGLVVPPANALEVVAAFKRHDLGMGAQCDG